MTTSLLRVSSVFLVQQNELHEMHNRMQKELTRMAQIQETLTLAAQEHQNAVLNVIQNYESLSVTVEAAAPAVIRSHQSNSLSMQSDVSDQSGVLGSFTSSPQLPNAKIEAPTAAHPLPVWR